MDSLFVANAMMIMDSTAKTQWMQNMLLMQPPLNPYRYTPPIDTRKPVYTHLDGRFEHRDVGLYAGEQIPLFQTFDQYDGMTGKKIGYIQVKKARQGVVMQVEIGEKMSEKEALRILRYNIISAYRHQLLPIQAEIGAKDKKGQKLMESLGFKIQKEAK